jgi:hypothetical protein
MLVAGVVLVACAVSSAATQQKGEERAGKEPREEIEVRILDARVPGLGGEWRAPQSSHPGEDVTCTLRIQRANPEVDPLIELRVEPGLDPGIAGPRPPCVPRSAPGHGRE